MAGRRIGGAGGGSDPGGRSSATALAAVAVAAAVVLGGTVSVSLGSGAGGASSSGGSSARAPSRANKASSDAAVARLKTRGVHIEGELTDDSTDCVEHSYGEVQEFLRRNRCLALHRAQLELRDPKGDVALVAAFWIEMSDEPAAAQLVRLLDTRGTGNIRELSREEGRYKLVRYSGPAYDSDRDGTFVRSAQAEPVARGWAGLALTAVISNVV